MLRLRHGALLGALALACTPRCSACSGASTPESPPPPPDLREYGDAVISDGQWTVVADEGGALRVRFNNTDVITSAFKFGGAGGASFDPVAGPTTRVGDAVQTSVEAPGLGVRVVADAKPSAHGATVAYTMHAERGLEDVSGGGIELTIRNEARILGKRAADPVALPGGNGFSWDSGRGVVRFEFSEKLPLLQATPTGGMQCALYYQQLTAGEHGFTLNVTLPGGGAWALAPFTRYPTPDASWHADTLPWNDTPVDLSFLNDDDKPAGKHGAVRIDGERLLRGDGAPLRLWGTNVVGYALFNASDDEIVRQAKRIAAFGFNLVRLHHHDSAWVEPNVFGRRAPSTLRLDPASLDRIDRWVAALEAEGIYVWIDLHVGRELTARDGIDAHAELERNNPHGFNYVNPSIAAAMKAFARAYLDRENPHTGRRYTDDPAVVGVLVTNENDLTMHFGNLMLERSGRPLHHGWLEARTREYAERSGLEIASPVEPWRLGNTKLAMGDIEAVFYRDAIDDLRELGYRGGVATSSLWGDQSLFSLPSLTVGDIVDTHSYGGPETLSSNAHVDPHFVHLVATAAVPGLPLSITEWNIPAPIRDRFVGPTLVAGIAALQGWAAPMMFAYASNPLEPPQRPEIWSSWD
ncbi:MAG: cellulase family glycosylhydrolase, partial [Deltaproteobacteria bacterium]|nr:cellulase family glycosylhydrolase [Nannocystaceae bacterium]